MQFDGQDLEYKACGAGYVLQMGNKIVSVRRISVGVGVIVALE
jgi:hypothetical protein